MQIELAQHMGFCFGVRDALEAAESQPEPDQVTIYGELVHNEEVQSRLSRRGFVALSERLRVIPETPRVMITAHGISDRERRHLEGAGKELIDTTCPLVRRAHKAAMKLQAEGHFVVVLGKPGHVEVIGLTGDLAGFAVVARESDARDFAAERIGVVAQTTTAPADVPPLLDAIRRANPASEVTFVDTICKPTRDRQQAAQALIERVDALVVVGGKNSNNTRALAEMARGRGLPALHVQGPNDLEEGWFVPYRHGRVGLTAGTSTPDETISAVHRALMEIARRLTALGAA